MKILEGKCPLCYGNLILSENSYTIECEECGEIDVATRVGDLVKLLIHVTEGVPASSTTLKKAWLQLKTCAVDYGTKEQREALTPAGQQLAEAYSANEPPDSEDVWNAILAKRGMIENKETLTKLRKGGFIM